MKNKTMFLNREKALLEILKEKGITAKRLGVKLSLGGNNLICHIETESGETEFLAPKDTKNFYEAASYYINFGQRADSI